MDRLISQFEVIRAIEKYVDNIFIKNMSDLVNDIKAISSAEPKTGHWIVHEHAEEFYGRVVDNYECDNCGDWYLNKTNFCPNCGCAMVKPQESEDKE